ncbi:hypothetical protein CC86DRAFT_409383 [Ophiobolus disseminans]|uniref:MARVEL domain-containing protein n=1 Tax=Ophiobolus disseminans TaxID=1469910 RepID=A0A6A6ZQY1_9PLEO|nr:hypothetical protein CC86DRAFT_409383 [Ophiobolus disseminans]
MQHKCNLITSSVLRGFQILLSIIVLGLSVTLFKNYNTQPPIPDLSKAPMILPLGAAIGSLSLIAAVFCLAIAWTNFLREYIEMLVDVVIVVVNVVGGMILALKLRGLKCGDNSDENRLGTSFDYPYNGGLANSDLLNGGCARFGSVWYCANTTPERLNLLNLRCKQSQADSAFMFLTAVVLFGTLTLTYLRFKKSL